MESRIAAWKASLSLPTLLALPLLVGCVASPVDQRTDPDVSILSDDTPAKLGAVPGFGVDDQEALRDDTIALWEAYQRDRVVASCMEDAGFTWHVQALYPESAVSQVADGVDAPRREVVEPWDPVSANVEVVGELDDDDLEAYYQALYGLDTPTAEDLLRGISEVEPGGCYEAGDGHGQRVWDLRDTIEPAVVEGRLAFRDTDAYAELTSQAGLCAAEFGIPEVTDQREADDAIDAGLDPDVVTQMMQGCGDIWNDRDGAERAHAAQWVWQQHSAELSGQLEHYATVWETLQADEDFLAHLSAVRLDDQ